MTRTKHNRSVSSASARKMLSRAVAAAVLFVVVGACSSTARPTSPGAASPGSESVSASGNQPTATPITATPASPATPGPAARYGPPITAADVTVSLPAVKDGRSLWPEGTWGGRIILEASLPVVPDPSGKQEGDNDDQFLAWDPVADTFQLLWTNVSRRYEDVWSTDGDWALSEMQRSNPFDQWELRLHNMATGEVRTVDAQDLATRDTAAAGLLDSLVVDGRVLWVRVALVDGRTVEQLRMLTIATGETTVLDSADWAPSARTSFFPGGINGDTVGYVRGAEGTARIVVLRSLSTGSERDVAALPGMTWEAISPDARFAVARQDPPPTMGSGPEGPRFAIDLATGEIRGFAAGQAYLAGVDFAAGYISWRVEASVNAVNGFFSLTSGLTRILDPSVHIDGQGARVFNGWYFWRELPPGVTVPQVSRADDVLRFMRIP